MKTTIAIGSILALFIFSCTSPRQEKVQQTDFAGLEHLLQQSNDTVYVINFWATWCKPCIEELPAFEQLNREYAGQKVKVILVSLDFPNRYNDQLLPFIEEHDVRSQVLHLTEVNANNWIDRVDPAWSGAIPATLVYKGNDREFYEQKLSYQELKTIVENKL